LFDIIRKLDIKYQYVLTIGQVFGWGLAGGQTSRKKPLQFLAACGKQRDETARAFLFFVNRAFSQTVSYMFLK
jgi:hypothetical protein